MPLLALVAVFILLPLAELYVILEVVGPWLDWYGTVALLVADSILGSLLLRAQAGVLLITGGSWLAAEGRFPWQARSASGELAAGGVDVASAGKADGGPQPALLEGGPERGDRVAA